MFHNNKELKISLILLSVATAILTLIAVTISITAGALVLLLGLISITVHLATEYYRYRKLQKLSSDLDKLLISGTPLPIREYSEGELSILANQIQKMTLRLTESAEAIKADKVYLADSLADISHQLRTPLTAMNLTTTMLRTPELSTEKRMELTGELRSLLTRTEWLVETLLKLSKLDAGTVKLAQNPVRVKNLIARAAKPIAIPMDLRNQTLIINCAEETFTGDFVWTAEALGNILKNCMEHTPEGGPLRLPLRKRLSTRKLKCKIPVPALMPRIFHTCSSASIRVATPPKPVMESVWHWLELLSQLRTELFRRPIAVTAPSL